MMDFDVEQGYFGERLVLRGEWNDDLIGYMLSRDIRELNVNYAKGFIGDDIDFLQYLPFLEGLGLLVYNIPDISEICSLHQLRVLDIACRDKTPLDFSQFPALEICGLDWRRRSESLFGCTTLKRLSIHHYSATDADSFVDLENLESLSFVGGSVRDLTGLRVLRKLKMLGLYRLLYLASLKGVEDLTNLVSLDIDTCRKLTSINEVRDLTNLLGLGVNNCGDIESLRAIEGLMKLQRLLFYESTNILDGDLSVLTRLPNLEDVRYMNRKHYSNRREEFPPFNASN